MQYHYNSLSPSFSTDVYKRQELAHSLGIQVNAGHGINYQNLEQLMDGVPYLHELNIGHTIVARALFVGMEQAVREMRQAIDRLS